jgi:hypothetical protein
MGITCTLTPSTRLIYCMNLVENIQKPYKVDYSERRASILVCWLPRKNVCALLLCLLLEQELLNRQQHMG